MQGSLDMVTPDLQDYAQVLKAAGFTVYAPPKSEDRPLTFFYYSRVVDGRTCYASVAALRFGGFTHSMPIKPSREAGSSMWVDPEHDDWHGDPEALTVEAAERAASPSNYNPVIGTHDNHKPWGIGTHYYPVA